MNAILLSAIDVGIIKLIVFAVVGFFWLINALSSARDKSAQQRREKAQRPPAGTPENPPGSDSEVEQFLKRANQRRAAPAPPRPATVANQSKYDAELRRKQSRAREQRPSGNRARRPAIVSPAPVVAEVIDTARTHESVADHVRATFDSTKFDKRSAQLATVDQTVEQLREQVQATFKHEVGSLKGASFESRDRANDQTSSAAVNQVAAVNPLARMLADPGSIRNAVILSEILQSPVDRW